VILPAGLAIACWIFVALTVPMGWTERLFFALPLMGAAVVTSAILQWGSRLLSSEAAAADAMLGGTVTAYGLTFFYQGGTVGVIPNLLVALAMLIAIAWRVRISTRAEAG